MGSLFSALYFVYSMPFQLFLLRILSFYLDTPSNCKQISYAIICIILP